MGSNSGSMLLIMRAARGICLGGICMMVEVVGKGNTNIIDDVQDGWLGSVWPITSPLSLIGHYPRIYVVSKEPIRYREVHWEYMRLQSQTDIPR